MNSPLQALLICLLVITLVTAMVVLIVVLKVRREGTVERDSPLKGRVGTYHGLRRVAVGGMAEIYRARNGRDTTVALKVLRRQFLRDSDIVDRFFQEGEVLEKIHQYHAGAPVVRLIAAGRDNATRRPYLAMEFLEATPLSALIKARGTLPEEAILTIARDVCAALAATHAIEYCHQDVSSDNVMVFGRHDRITGAKLIDYGVSNRLNETTESNFGASFGKPAFMSPEQCRGERSSASSDLYSLGVMLYHAAAGKLPYQSPNLMEVMEMHQHAPVPSVPGNFSVPFQRVVASLLSKDTDNRLPSANAVWSFLLQSPAAPRLSENAAPMHPLPPAAVPAPGVIPVTPPAPPPALAKAPANAGSTLLRPGAGSARDPGTTHAVPHSDRRQRLLMLARPLVALSLLGAAATVQVVIHPPSRDGGAASHKITAGYPPPHLGATIDHAYNANARPNRRVASIQKKTPRKPAPKAWKGSQGGSHMVPPPVIGTVPAHPIPKQSHGGSPMKTDGVARRFHRTHQIRRRRATNGSSRSPGGRAVHARISNRAPQKSNGSRDSVADGAREDPMGDLRE